MYYSYFTCSDLSIILDWKWTCTCIILTLHVLIFQLYCSHLVLPFVDFASFNFIHACIHCILYIQYKTSTCEREKNRFVLRTRSYLVLFILKTERFFFVRQVQSGNVYKTAFPKLNTSACYIPAFQFIIRLSLSIRYYN